MKNKAHPLVSIIIPFHSREIYLNATILSVVNQTYTNWELILVNDGASDQILELVKSFSKEDARIKVILRPDEKPAGGNGARNYGFEKSSGNFINWFDSDDLMHPEFIERKVCLFQEFPQIDIVFSRTIKTDFADWTVYDSRLKDSPNKLEDFILREISWYLHDGMFRRCFLNNKNLFDEYIRGGQDRDFYIRILAQQDPRIKIMDFYASWYRMHKNSISEEMYRSQNYNLQISHYKSLLNQIQTLQKNKKMTKKLKSHYFQEIQKRFPAVIKTNSSKIEFLRTLIFLSQFRFQIIKGWSKLFVAYLSFSVFGKGERLLK